MAVLKSFTCPTCGAPMTITGDAPEEECRFCGNTLIVPPELLYQKPVLPPSLEEVKATTDALLRARQAWDAQHPGHGRYEMLAKYHKDGYLSDAEFESAKQLYRKLEAGWQPEVEVEFQATEQALLRARQAWETQHPGQELGARERAVEMYKDGYLSDAEFESAKKLLHF